jgi:methylthioribose-1-phosphate isomerase
MESIIWHNNSLKILDQTKLPLQKEYVLCKNHKDVINAINTMQVRGAPAIGVAAAFGIVLGSNELDTDNIKEIKNHLQKIKENLKNTRPTAVNLFWALKRMEHLWKNNNYNNVQMLKKELENEAVKIFEEDIRLNRLIGKNGFNLIPQNANILTYCNTGALATAGFGTALGIIRMAKKNNKKILVYACETRPLLQGARLTVTELMDEGIEVKLITDNMAGYLMKQKKVDLVIVGADRICSNGDVANKIGTYSLAVLAKHHKIPFYVAAPNSTIDYNLGNGEDIVIEERNPEEIRSIFNNRIVKEEVRVYNPAFDVTPNNLIDAIITDKGILRFPYNNSINNIRKE